MRSLLFYSLVVSGILIFKCERAFSQITPDNTLGAESSVVNTRDATSESIDGGAVRGQNLFHSFQEFNVDAGRGAYFANPDAVTNIFSRVTGGNPSNILGTLGVDGAANLFLINPNGIIFGQGASLDVQGSFTATTADGVEFGEQGFFSAVNPESPKLLTINPSAYFFNQLSPGAIANNSIGLRVPDGQNLLLLGGDVNVDGGGIVASGGRIDIGAIAGQGVIGLNSNGSLNIPDSIARGDVSLTNGAAFLVYGDGGGDIAIAAKNINILSRSNLNAGVFSNSSLPDAQAGDITIDATDNIIVDNGRVANEVSLEAVGNAGDIFINANSLQVLNGSLIESLTSGQGDSGNVTVRASNIELAGTSSDGQLSSSLFTNIGSQAQGNGGNLTINTDNLSLSDRAEISASTFGQGDTGNISITADNSISLDASSYILNNVQSIDAVGDAGKIEITTGSLSATNGSQIDSFTRGRGNAGNISITADNSVSLDTSSYILNNVESSDAVGNAGKIEITTGSLSATNGSQIDSATRGRGNAGDITIQASNAVTFDGFDNNGFPSASFSSVEAGSEGDGGNINIQTGNLVARNGGQINAGTLGKGDTGNISITADNSVSLDTSSSIVNNVQGIDAVGDAGKIEITTGSLSATNGSQIDSFTRGRGNAGDITIQASNAVTFDGFDNNGLPSASFSSVEAGSEGDGGNINIQTRNLVVRNGGEINASTLGKGDTGNIFITADNSISLDVGSRIVNNVQGIDAVGDAGKIEITTGSLSATNGSQIDSFTRGRGNAGNITIQARNDVIFDGLDNNGLATGSFSSVEAGGKGDGGDINIQTGNLVVRNGGQIIAGTSGKGDTGNIFITADNSISLDASSYIFNNVESIDAVGDAGKIEINTGSLLATNGSQIDSFTRGQGNAGNITIQASNDVTFDGFGNNGLFSAAFSSVEAGGKGDGGNINLTARSLSLTNGGKLDVGVRQASASLPSGRGKGGNINIDVDDALTIADGSRINAITFGQGNAGKLEIKANSLNLDNNAFISSVSETNFDAGDITLNIANSIQATDSSISTSSTQSSGGNLTINAGDIKLRGNSDLTTDIASGQGSGGNINITADSVIAFDDSDIFASAPEGQGGNVTLDTPAYFGENFTLNSLTANPDTLDNNSRADVNATGAVSSGTVSIPNVSFIQNSLNDLPNNSINTDELVANSCVVPVGDRSQGKFIITGTESLPVRPGDNLPSKYPTGEVRNVPEKPSGWQPGDPIIEPQGAYRLANGKLVLSRQCSR